MIKYKVRILGTSVGLQSLVAGGEHCQVGVEVLEVRSLRVSDQTHKLQHGDVSDILDHPVLSPD